MTQANKSTLVPSRRDFLKTSAVVAGAALGSMPLVSVHAQETKRTFKAALIGCGGRGNGAMTNHIEAAQYLNEKLGWNLEIKVVATADWFAGRAKDAGKRLQRARGSVASAAPTATRRPSSATPTSWSWPSRRPSARCTSRPPSRPASTSSSRSPRPSIRSASAGSSRPAKLAKQKGLASWPAPSAATTAATTSGRWRSRTAPTAGSWPGAWPGTWARSSPTTRSTPRAPTTWSAPWQIWVEMSGDHICEQHVHNLDIANWYCGAHPVSAGGFGFRAAARPATCTTSSASTWSTPRTSTSTACAARSPTAGSWVGEDFVYEKPKPSDFKVQSADPYEVPGYHGNAYVGEHAHLLYAIVKEQPINEAQNVAWATGAAILCRESAYSGKRITWDEMFENPTKNPSHVQPPVEALGRGLRGRRSHAAERRRHPHPGRVRLILSTRP